MNLITNKGGFTVTYADPQMGLTRAQISASTVSAAMAVFTSLELTSFGDLLVDRYNTDGALTDTFLLVDGPYAVPTRIGPRETNPGVGSSTRRRPARRNRRYNRV